MRTSRANRKSKGLPSASGQLDLDFSKKAPEKEIQMNQQQPQQPESSLQPKPKQNQEKIPYWFCDYMGFEEKQSRANRLILDFRRWSPEPKSTITSTIYVDEPSTISTEFLFGLDNIVKHIDVCKADEELSKFPLKVFISYTLEKDIPSLKDKYPDVEFVKAKGKFSVINLDIPYDSRLLGKLGFKFQKGNHNKQVRRKIDCMYRKLNAISEMEALLVHASRLREVQDRMGKLVELLVPGDPKDRKISSQRTRLKNELNKFFNSYSWSHPSDDYSEAKQVMEELWHAEKSYPSLRKAFSNMETSTLPLLYLMDAKKETSEIISKASSILEKIDKGHGAQGTVGGKSRIEFNGATGEYEITLSSTKLFNFGDKLDIDEIKQQVYCYIDIEKPIWKHKDEKINIDRRQKVIKIIDAIDKALENKPQGRKNYSIKFDCDSWTKTKIFTRLKDIPKDRPPSFNEGLVRAKSRAENILLRLEKRLTLNWKNVGEVKMWEDRYDAKISQVVITFKLEDGSLVRNYHKLKYNSSYSPEEIKGFKVYEHKNEQDLLNSIVASARKYRAFANVAHVITYDLPQLREGTRKNHTDRLDIVVPDKEPSLAFARDFYRKMAQSGQEMFDTCMMGKTLFPYLRIKAMGSSHRLVDMINYVRLLKNPDGNIDQFEKIATHEELRDLEIKRMNGDIEADRKLDDYTTGDSAPMEELMDFYFIYLDKISKVIPNVTFTDIMFAPSCMDEIVRKKHWDENHNQYLFGYKQKEREDVLQIFKKRFSSYRKRKLQAVGIRTFNSRGSHKNVYMAYIPWEEWLKDAALVRYPELKAFYDTLGPDMNPVMRLGLLQYVKRFYRQTMFPDYYLYRREHDIVWQYKQRLGAMREFDKVDTEAIHLLLDYKAAMNRRVPGLLDKYYSAYDMVKNLYRSFYTSIEELPNKQKREEIRKAIRVAGGNREETGPTFDFYNLFFEENIDLMELHKNHEQFQDMLLEKSRGLLGRFQSTFKSLNAVFKDLQQEAELALGETKINSKVISKENLVYFYNQHWRAEKKRAEFVGKYGIYPEPSQRTADPSFREILDAGYERLAKEIRERCLDVVAYKGDYLFVRAFKGKDVDFSGTTMIPIQKFEEFSAESTSLEKDDEEMRLLFPTVEAEDFG